MGSASLPDKKSSTMEAKSRAMCFIKSIFSTKKKDKIKEKDDKQNKKEKANTNTHTDKQKHIDAKEIPKYENPVLAVADALKTLNLNTNIKKSDNPYRFEVKTESDNFDKNDKIKNEFEKTDLTKVKPENLDTVKTEKIQKITENEEKTPFDNMAKEDTKTPVQPEKNVSEKSHKFGVRTIKVDDNVRPGRIDSQSSETSTDSGFADTKEDLKEDVIESFQNLNLEGPLVSRGPAKDHKKQFYHPYKTQGDINQVNRLSLTGGHVIVNKVKQADIIDNVPTFKTPVKTIDEQQALEDVYAVINNDCTNIGVITNAEVVDIINSILLNPDANVDILNANVDTNASVNNLNSNINANVNNFNANINNINANVNNVNNFNAIVDNFNASINDYATNEDLFSESTISPRSILEDLNICVQNSDTSSSYGLSPNYGQSEFASTFNVTENGSNGYHEYHDPATPLSNDSKFQLQVPSESSSSPKSGFHDASASSTSYFDQNFAFGADITQNEQERFHALLSGTNEAAKVPNIELESNAPESSIFTTPPPSNCSETTQRNQAYCDIFSPETINNNDYENFQNIAEEPKMTLKIFKDLLKEIVNGFTKKECCELRVRKKRSRECNQIFEYHLSKLSQRTRVNICLNIAKLSVSEAYGVLLRVLVDLSKSKEEDNLRYAIFGQTCSRVLMDQPKVFLGDMGLNVLKAAALRCPHRPELTRYIVQVIYRVMKNEHVGEVENGVFDETDGLGDNLVMACARAGDAYAQVLYEITQREEYRDMPPLFNTQHVNKEGHSALHVACSLHSDRAPRLHVVHVLLEHARADIWKGDARGGDSALHLAVSAAECDLKLVLMIFSTIERNDWKKLAKHKNMSSKTPHEIARVFAKSNDGKNYHKEVYSFLSKCR